MNRQVKIMATYLLVLFLSSFFIEGGGLEKSNYLLNKSLSSLVNPLVIITVFGGFFALWLILPRPSFLVFLFLYVFLWVIRFVLLVVSEKIGLRVLGGHTFNFSLIIPKYYYSITRLTTPIPFFLFWFIHILFSGWKKYPQNYKS